MKKIILGVIFALFIGGGIFYALVLSQDTNVSEKIQSFSDGVKIVSDEITGHEPEPLLTFFVFGDNEGVNPIVRRIWSDAREQRGDFVVNVADLTSHGREEQFTEVRQLFDGYGVPYYTAIGNNDLGKPKPRELFLKYFGVDGAGAAVSYITVAAATRTYFSFDRAGVHFVVLDNADRKVGFDDEQLTWLADDLAANRQPHTLLFYPRPFDLPFSEFFYDDETATSRASNEKFLQIIGGYTIDAIFTGHVHTYIPYRMQNIPVTVTGGGGAAPQDYIGGDAVKLYHYMKVTVTEDGIQTKFVPIE